MCASNNDPSVIELEPLAVTFKVGGKISGFGQTTLWKLGKERRIRLIRPPGTRRTLIDFGSLKELLLSEESATEQRRRRGRSPKTFLRLPEENTSK
jgi:hypothetical protein